MTKLLRKYDSNPSAVLQARIRQMNTRGAVKGRGQRDENFYEVPDVQWGSGLFGGGGGGDAAADDDYSDLTETIEAFCKANDLDERCCKALHETEKHITRELIKSEYNFQEARNPSALVLSRIGQMRKPGGGGNRGGGGGDDSYYAADCGKGKGGMKGDMKGGMKGDMKGGMKVGCPEWDDPNWWFMSPYDHWMSWGIGAMSGMGDGGKGWGGGGMDPMMMKGKGGGKGKGMWPY